MSELVFTWLSCSFSGHSVVAFALSSCVPCSKCFVIYSWDSFVLAQENKSPSVYHRFILQADLIVNMNTVTNTHLHLQTAVDASKSHTLERTNKYRQLIFSWSRCREFIPLQVDSMEEDLVRMAILTRQANQMHEMDKDEPS